MFEVIYYIIWGITTFYAVYLAICGVFAYFKPKVKINKHKDKTKFAIVIPARNEEKVIGDLIDSLNNQNYTRELFDIYVIINNSNDKTEEIALNKDSNVLTVPYKVSGKGEVLTYAFEELKTKKYDAYIIFDADNVVHPDFINKMNDAYQSGYRYAQGRKDSKNISDNWISVGHTLFYYIQNFFYNKARTNINGYSTINGTGFMIEKSFLDNGFEPKTITEDIELSIMCMLNDKQIIYIDDAITYDEQPTSFMVSWKQRIRWSKGIMECAHVYTGKLLKKLNFNTFDKCIFITALHSQILSSLLALIKWSINIVTSGLSAFDQHFIVYTLITSLIVYVGNIILNIYILKVYRRSIKDNLIGILLFPLFLATWVPINILCLFKKRVVWEHIEHNKNIKIEELTNK